MPKLRRKHTPGVRPQFSYDGVCDKAVAGSRIEVEENFVVLAWRRPAGG